MDTIFSAKRLATQFLNKYTQFIQLNPQSARITLGQDEIRFELYKIYCPLSLHISSVLISAYLDRVSASGKEININRSFFLNMIAFCNNYKDWNHMFAELKNKPFMPTYILRRDKDGETEILVSIHNESNETRPLAYTEYLVQTGNPRFEWGYSGSTPLETAKAILMDLHDDEEISSEHNKLFVNHCLSLLPDRCPSEYLITGYEVEFFANKHGKPELDYIKARLG